MRRIVLLLGVSLLVWSCEGDAASTSTTAMPSNTTTSSTPSTTIPATSTSMVSGWPGMELLVTNNDGVFYVDSAGEVSQLVIGRVAYAVDDTRGGLLFQVDRGRSDRSSTSASADLDTTVWWVPRGAGEAQALLVPTPGAGQDLTLYDAFANHDGGVQVVYVRSDTPLGYWDWFTCTHYRDCPEVPTWYPGIHEDLIDRLRIYDLDRQSVTEAQATGVFESGISDISAGGGHVVVMFHNQVGQDCVLLDPSTAIEPTESPAQGVWAAFVWAPWIEPGCEWPGQGPGCPDICTLSRSGGLFGFTVAGQTLVVDTKPGGERLILEGQLIDLSDTHVLVDDGDSVEVVSLADQGDSGEVPVGGEARFAVAPVAIDGPVVPPTPAAIQLRADGLGVVDFGEPVDEVMAVLTDMLGPPDWEEVQISADTDLSVRWGKDGEELLYLQFTYWDYFDAALEPTGPMPEGPVFHYYLTKSDLLYTEARVTVGSTVSNLKTAYRDVRFGRDCGSEQWLFYVDPPAGRLALPIFGLLDGDFEDAATRIIHIGAGWDRTPC